jgi:hypothetical protein
MSTLDDLADRKAILVATAELQRLEMTLAWRDIRGAVSPAPSPDRALWARPKVAAFLSFALPLVGARRLGRAVRLLSFGLMALRAVRGWRS